MGDISGRPKAPPQQVVYVPQYVYETPTNTNNPQTPAPTPEEEAAQRREKSLLSRSRSRLGTILTGFRGLLSPIETDDKRKTLLGE